MGCFVLHRSESGLDRLESCLIRGKKSFFLILYVVYVLLCSLKGLYKKKIISYTFHSTE